MAATIIEELDTQYYKTLKNLMTAGFHIEFTPAAIRYYAENAFSDKEELANFFHGKYVDMNDPAHAEVLCDVLEELEKNLIAPLTDDNLLIETGYDEERDLFFIRKFIVKDVS